jgi:hypothetical protein
VANPRSRISTSFSHYPVRATKALLWLRVHHHARAEVDARVVASARRCAMKRLLRLALPLALVVVVAAGTNRAEAGCPGCDHALFGDNWEGGGLWPFSGGLGGFDAWAFIEVPPNLSNVYPDGGFTAYDGMWATGYQVHSNYSPINWVQPPAASAQSVLLKLQEMHIPLVSPEPMFLNKNPRIAENVRLPAPRIMKKVKDKEE